MSEDIKTRLQDSAAECLKSYEVWSESKKDSSARENLHAAVHELRKVASRLEIELAVSDRDQNTQKKIPIPTHRDSGRRHHNKDENINNLTDLMERIVLNDNYERDDFVKKIQSFVETEINEYDMIKFSPIYLFHL